MIRVARPPLAILKDLPVLRTHVRGKDAGDDRAKGDGLGTGRRRDVGGGVDLLQDLCDSIVGLCITDARRRPRDDLLGLNGEKERSRKGRWGPGEEEENQQGQR